jgi:hypothetical protein
VIAPSRGENRGRWQKEAFAMSAQRASIAQVMMVVALAAVNLAVLRITPLEIVTYPANLLAIIDGAVWGWMVESRVRLTGHLVLEGVCLILGGLIGLSRLKSSALGREGNSG